MDYKRVMDQSACYRIDLYDSQNLRFYGIY